MGGSTNGSNGSNGSLPPWARVVTMVGAPTIITFYLLGMLPGLRSPFDKIMEEFRASAAALEAHEQTARETLRVNRHICRGIWKGDPVMQAGCGRNGNHYP